MLDFARVAAAALAQAERLCQSWLGGHRSGHEWVGEKRSNGGLGDSWSVNLGNGSWAHFGGDEKGGDLIALYAALNHTTQLAALEAVAALVGVTNGAAGPPALRVVEDAPAGPAPADAGLPRSHPEHGDPSAVYHYVNAAGELMMLVCRYETPSGKKFAQYTWRRERWTAKSLPAPRPLYGLPELSIRPDDPVLVVEGEKCHQAASGLMAAYVCVTWAGGAQSVKTADWSVLKGRDVLLWPDADEPGRAAMAQLAGILLPLASRVRLVDTAGQPDGWDLADAIADGWNRTRITAWAKTRVKTLEAKPKITRVITQQQSSAVVSWQSLGLHCNDGGKPHPTVANAAKILTSDPRVHVNVWFDDFRGKIYCTDEGRERPWTDADDFVILKHINAVALLANFNLKTVQHAVQLVAFEQRRNSVCDWLKSLKWDGIERLSHWVCDYLGCTNTKYSQAVGRNWLISMVARALRPGCQADHMPVLEGKSGRGKSSTLAILGGDWYRAAPQAFGSKEFFEVIQGAWLVEIPDMVGFGRREHTQIISAITTRSDSYRAAYGRYVEDHPRTVTFVATSETDEYLQDSRGIRRYWPLRCGEIDLTLLAAMRDQLFAEAVARFKSGAMWHEMPTDETPHEQRESINEDVWQERVLTYAAGQVEFTSTAVLDHLEIPVRDQHDGQKRRVKAILCAAGWEQKVIKDEGHSIRKWVRKDE